MNPTQPPLVTFALFAYNQEAYVREAIASAFAQTYEPLEIILSDDCSADRTHAIMCEMAADYRGPHRIKLLRSPVNRGFADHINRVAGLAEGEIVVMAAGDDAYVPTRTAEIVRVFQDHTETAAVLSDYDAIPAGGELSRYRIGNAVVSLTEVVASGGGVQIGATYAYRRDCFAWPAPLPDWIESEDRILPLRAALLGRLRYIPLPLVHYRLPALQPGRERRHERILGNSHPRQFDMLREHIAHARAERRISAPKAWFLALLIELQRLAALSQGIGSSAALLPVRLSRKLAVLATRVVYPAGNGRQR